MGFLKNSVKSIFLPLLVFPLFVHAKNIRIEEIRALKTAEPSLVNSYLDLMESKKLIHQTDARLKKRQLLKETGGLCAFTAQANAIQSVSQYYQIATSKFLKRPDYFLYEIIDEARSYMEEDPLYDGTDLLSLQKYTTDVLEEYGLDEIIKIKHVTDIQEMDPIKLKSYFWKIRLLGMMSEDQSEGHTVVALKFDLKKNILYASDPNFPNKILRIPYAYNRHGLKLFLSDSFPGFQPAIVDEINEISISKK